METLRAIQDLMENVVVIVTVFLRRNWLAVLLFLAIGSALARVFIDVADQLKKYVAGSRTRVAAAGLVSTIGALTLPTWWASLLAFPLVFGALLLVWQRALARVQLGRAMGWSDAVTLFLFGLVFACPPVIHALRQHRQRAARAAELRACQDRRRLALAEWDSTRGGRPLLGLYFCLGTIDAASGRSGRTGAPATAPPATSTR